MPAGQGNRCELFSAHDRGPAGSVATGAEMSSSVRGDGLDWVFDSKNPAGGHRRAAGHGGHLHPAAGDPRQCGGGHPRAVGVPQPGRAGPVQRPVRVQQAVVLPVPALARPPAAGEPRVLMEARPVGRLAARPAAAEDDHPRPLLHDPPADHRRAGRSLAGGAAQQTGRLHLHRAVVPVLRRADVLRRCGAHPGVLVEAAVVRGRSAAGRGRGRPDQLARPDAPGRHAGPRDHRPVQPVHAVLGTRQHHRGLRAHRQGEGRVVAPGAVAARDAQLADPDRHPARAVDTGDLVRGADHRVGVQLPGDGVPVLPVGAEPGLPRAARLHHRRRDRHRRRVPARRPRVRRARPAREVRVTAADGQAPGPATDTVESPVALPATKPRGMFLRGLEVFLENKLAIVGVVLLVLIFGFCFLGPLFYHTDQVHVNLANENLAPGPGHPLGTDQNGYDVLGRLMVAGQISLEVGLAAAVLATVLGTLWGAVAGYFGGITDSVMMRIVDALLAIPTLFLALVVVSIWPPTETELILVIALTSWLTTSRLIRGEALSLRIRDYVQAMRVMGGGSARAVFRHIAPNSIGTIIVNATFQVADAILLIVALSYLGLGIRPPQTDWGGMLNAGLNAVYDGYWWQIFPAGIAIILVVIAINFIGDALRDAFEVRLQRRLSSLLGGVFLLAPLLSIDDLRTEIRLRHGVVHAIDGVSLTVNHGECLGIVGESGSGKTMTALSVMRLLPGGGSVVGGTITVDGVDVTSLSESGMEDVRGNLIGMIFQDPLTSLNPTMTIGEQIAESVRLHRGASKTAALDRAVEVLGLVGMPKPAERISNYPHQLSGGMRQRVMIAMALACEPKLLIADEPTTALDVTIQKQILELIDSLRQRLSMAVILVTHDLGVIAGRADRVAVMYAGRIVELAPTPVLFARPRHPYTEALFEALPEKAADGSTIKRLYNIPGQPPDLSAPPVGCKFAPRCRYAQDSCRASEPSLTDAGGAHFFRSFFPAGSPQEARGPGTPCVSVPPERPEAPGTPAAELAASGVLAGGVAAAAVAGPAGGVDAAGGAGPVAEGA